MCNTIDTNWDIDSYKTHHESDEHWELRRKFMETHKERLPEDELVCLAQVFTNIEFLGCRYPNETMIRVAELAKGVVEEFREKKKNTLKRTFVAASDAASSKVKGSKRVHISTDSGVGNNSMVIASNTRRKILQPLDGPFPKFIVVITRCKSAFHILERSIQINRLQNCSFNSEEDKAKGLVRYTVTMEGQEVSSAVAVDKKTAQELAAENALSMLREKCFSILEESDLVGQNVEKSDLGRKAGTKNMPEAAAAAPAADSVGSKLMRMMGWAGGGLGSGGQGRVDPVEAKQTQYRQGIGFGGVVTATVNSSCTPKQFRTDVYAYLLKWLSHGAKSDLLFSSEFDKDQRKIAHEVAQRLGLKSKSYGKDPDRRLVVSKKLSIWDLAQELYEAGGHSDKYQLLKPGEPLPSSQSRVDKQS